MDYLFGLGTRILLKDSRHVSILVLMDYLFGPLMVFRLNGRGFKVSILVLMDYLFGHAVKAFYRTNYKVSILVLMDYLFGHAVDIIPATVWGFQSLF